jgi:hypothetical protein
LLVLFLKIFFDTLFCVWWRSHVREVVPFTYLISINSKCRLLTRKGENTVSSNGFFKQVSLMMDDVTREKLLELARKNATTRSQLIRTLVLRAYQEEFDSSDKERAAA